tara:strand:+ start:4275 stop:4538 length:264 start_codon:yes stop_codon:yes gene_type:complete
MFISIIINSYKGLEVKSNELKFKSLIIEICKDSFSKEMESENIEYNNLLAESTCDCFYNKFRVNRSVDISINECKTIFSKGENYINE